MIAAAIIFAATKLHIVILLIAGCSLFFISSAQRIKILLTALTALPIVFVVSRIASQLFYNPRPFVTDGVGSLFPHVADNGFPSDHALLVATVASLVFIYNRKLGIGLFVLGLMVGIARVLAGVHHTLDIVGSFAIAIILTYLTQVLFSKFYPDNK